MKKELVSIRFTRPNPPYVVGEIAGFPAKIADKFVNGKKPVAVLNIPEDEVPVEVEPDEMLCGFPVSEFDFSAEAREPEHIGGGVYEVAGVRVKGKAAVADLLEALPALEDDDGEEDPDGETTTDEDAS